MAGCGMCGFDWTVNEGDLPVRVGRLGSQYRAQVDSLRDAQGEHALRVRPAPSVWSPSEYVVHMRDVADFYLDRIQRVRSEERPQLPVIHFDVLADERRYNDEDVDGALGRLDILASTAAERLASLTSDEWRRVGVGSDGDERDVLVLARRLAHEGHHHLVDLTS